MKKKPVKYLDTLFREGLAAAKVQPEAVEQEWAAMEQRLERRDRRRRIFFWLRTAGGAGMLAILLLLFRPQTEHSPDLSATAADSIQNSGEPGSTASPSPAEKNSINPGNPATKENAHPPIHPGRNAPRSPNAGIAAGDSVNRPVEMAPAIVIASNRMHPVKTSPAERIGSVPIGVWPLPGDRLQATGVAGINSASGHRSEPGSEAGTKNDAAQDSTGSLFHEDPAGSRRSHQRPQQGSFYYGLSAGPDFSRVGSQAVRRAGYSAGILAGYRFHPRWSAELGLVWMGKQYQTDGTYFDKDAAGFPSYLSLLSLDGGCKMVVVPLMVRYHFDIGSQPFFAGLGANAYFMKEEHYAYIAETNNGSRYEGNRLYKNSGNHLFSHLQLSAGYSYRLSPRTSLRAEPYFHIPLKKIGIGRMPLTSAGLQLGIIRDLNGRSSATSEREKKK